MTEGVIIEAVVQVGAQETHYLRCGRGDRVIVVLAGDPDERLRLLRRYAAGHCVIAPVPAPLPAVQEPGSRDAAVELWLRGVIDGLGLDRPAVLLAADHAWLADRLVAGWNDTVDAVCPAPAQEC